jgi:ribonuclease HI
MELTAVIKGLQALPRPCHVTITTDSRYVLNPFEKNWLHGWKERAVNGIWLTSDRKPVKNQELWEQLEAEVARHHVTWVWVRGHNGHPYNERCDRLAVAEYRALLSP